MQLALAQQLRDAIAADDGDAFNDAIAGIQEADQTTTEARTAAAAEPDAPTAPRRLEEHGRVVDRLDRLGTEGDTTTTGG